MKRIVVERFALIDVNQLHHSLMISHFRLASLGRRTQTLRTRAALFKKMLLSDATRAAAAALRFPVDEIERRRSGIEVARSQARQTFARKINDVPPAELLRINRMRQQLYTFSSGGKVAVIPH
jgi:hypothetical protein